MFGIGTDKQLVFLNVDGHLCQYIFQAPGPGNGCWFTDVGLVGLGDIPGAFNSGAYFRVDVLTAGNMFETAPLF
jgi:hypothetical protein